MAFWNKKRTEMERTYRLIQSNPGLSATELSELMKVAPTTIQRRLPRMEEAGMLLSQDAKGRLWPFECNLN